MGDRREARLPCKTENQICMQTIHVEISMDVIKFKRHQTSHNSEEDKFKIIELNGISTTEITSKINDTSPSASCSSNRRLD